VGRFLSVRLISGFYGYVLIVLASDMEMRMVAVISESMASVM